jgi:homoserine kinase
MIRVRVPASSSNLGPGFDAVGLALRLYNTITLEPAEIPQIDIQGEGAETLPHDPTHLAYRAAAAVVRLAGLESSAPPAFRLRQHNRIPLTRGVGSSAAAILGGAVAANALLGDPLDRQAVLDLATEMEGHPDNVAPALVGGVVVCARTRSGVVWTRLGPERLPAVLAIPDYAVSTRDARRLLPAHVPFEDAVFNVARTALLIAALVEGRTDLLAEATQDRLHQPYRERLVPGLSQVFAAARAAGAFGVALSGSGPSVLAFGDAPGIGDAMAAAFRAAGAGCRTLTVEIDLDGTIVEPSA